MNDFAMKLGNFEALPERGDDNFATGIYEIEHDGLLIARCNQNGRYPEHARAILEGLNGKRRGLDELTQHLDLTPVAKRIFEAFCGSPVDWSRHAMNDAEDSIFASADWAQAMLYAKAALSLSSQTTPDSPKAQMMGSEKNRIQGMVRSIDQYRNSKPEAIMAGSHAQALFALTDARHDILVLWDALSAREASE